MDRNIVEYIKDHIKEYLPPEYKNAEVTVNDVLKNNDRTLTGLTILKDGSNIAPTIYLEPYAADIEAGRPIDSVLEEIAKIQQTESTRMFFDASFLKDYEKVKPRLFVRMCDPEKSTEYLKDKPHTAYGELAATYRIRVMAEEEMTGSAVVTNDMLQTWGITKEQLHQDTIQAESVRNPAGLYRMDDLLFASEQRNLLEAGEPLHAGSLPIYVLTNQDKTDGAGVIVQDGILEKVGGLMGADFYMLPSSIHEVLILPDDGGMDIKELQKMVREVNATQVAPDEVLSDKVQYYDRAAKTLGRKQEKGILGRLADNKKQIQERDSRGSDARQTSRNEPSL